MRWRWTTSPSEAAKVATPEFRDQIAAAIAAFKARAEIIKTALAGRSYKLQRLNVSSGYNAPQPRFATAARMVAAAPEVAAPNLEAGVSVVTVNAGGAIEVLE